MKKKQSFDNLVEEALVNIREDRQETKDLLADLTAYITSGTDRHKEVGFTLAKYLEVLQRSNEQLVKITTIIKKKEDGNEDLNEDDRNSIFDELNTAVQAPAAKDPKKIKKK